MASAVGFLSSNGRVCGGATKKAMEMRGRGGGKVRCASTTSSRLRDQYRALRILPGASEREVKKAFRQLALQYHPDVCKGNNCDLQFRRINEAYGVVMSSLRKAAEQQVQQAEEQEARRVHCDNDGMRGRYDPSYDLWEEWMGWEGAGIRDYSSHINPYI